MEAGLRSMCFSPGAWTPKSVILFRDYSDVGAENICENITIALKRAETIYHEGAAAVSAPANSL
jgi:hypothetical protein